MNKQIMVTINGKGELLWIDPPVVEVSDILVPLEGYYEVFNDQGYPCAKYNLNTKTWEGFHIPKWDEDDSRWVELANVDDILKQKKLDQLVPSAEELAKADRTLELIDVLTDLGVI